MHQIVKFKNILKRQRETDDSIITTFHLTFDLDSYCTAFSSAYIHNLFNNEINIDFLLKKLKISEATMHENCDEQIEKLNEFYKDNYILINFSLFRSKSVILNIKKYNKYNIII